MNKLRANAMLCVIGMVLLTAVCAHTQALHTKITGNFASLLAPNTQYCGMEQCSGKYTYLDVYTGAYYGDDLRKTGLAAVNFGVQDMGNPDHACTPWDLCDYWEFSGGGYVPEAMVATNGELKGNGNLKLTFVMDSPDPGAVDFVTRASHARYYIEWWWWMGWANVVFVEWEDFPTPSMHVSATFEKPYNSTWTHTVGTETTESYNLKTMKSGTQDKTSVLVTGSICAVLPTGQWCVPIAQEPGLLGATNSLSLAIEPKGRSTLH